MSAKQGELFTNAPGEPDARAPVSAPAPMQVGPTPVDAGPEPAPVWLQRLSLIVLVVFCFYIGGLLVFLPWWGRYWLHNGWLMGHPLLYELFQRNWVRGVVSGLGLLDVWIGVSEVIHYRDYRV